MDVRQQDVEPAHRHTFGWILGAEKDYEDSLLPTKVSPFLQWLEGEDPLLWLSGKPGSGKSTLMKFIVTHPALGRILLPYFPGKRLVVVSHYLYERGSESLQKSREGLLRHLLHGILLQCPELSWIVFRLHKATRSFDYQKSWSWRELKEAFKAVLAGKPGDIHIICFVDGLDEYRPMTEMELASLSGDLHDEEEMSDMISDGHQEVADLVLEVARYGCVKLLVSSRPFTVFRNAFSPFGKMELHMLTEADISHYVADRLSGNPLLASLHAGESPFAKEVDREIQAKADGVFLWVRLVLDVFFRRLRQYDTAEELLQRIHEMPPKLGGRSGLYMTMLLNLSPRDRLEAYKYFQILLHASGGLDPLVLSFAMADPRKVFTEPMQAVDPEVLRSRRRFSEDRSLTRTGGLLQAKDRWGGPNDGFVLIREISFIHLTAKEFVSDPDSWRHLLSAAEPPEFDGLLALLRASLMVLKCTTPMQLHEIWYLLRRFLHYASKLENHTASTRPELLLLLDAVMFNFHFHTYNRDEVFEPWSEFQDDTDLSYEDLVARILPRLLQASATLAPTRPHWAVMEPGKVWLPDDKGLVAVAVQGSLFLFLEFLQIQDAAVVSPSSVSTAATVQRLLQSGQSPNQKYEGPAYWPDSTVWEGFLVYGGDCLDNLRSRSGTDETQALSWTLWLDNAALMVHYGADLRARCHIRSLTGDLRYQQRSALFIVALVLWRLGTPRRRHVELLEVIVGKGALLMPHELQTFRTLVTPTNATAPLARDIVRVLAKAEPPVEGAVSGVGADTSQVTPDELIQAISLSLNAVALSDGEYCSSSVD
ncbi:hypothetical protein PG993_010527 [Apiospora rasikravindrae]|uniref:Nephrocystin 3-like N-terminal domain-containing protein n=1 Tax=Apiospora rasikravindrae TaxID=990691 RepID=A0ABR1SMJ4_9PEZI